MSFMFVVFVCRRVSHDFALRRFDRRNAMLTLEVKKKEVWWKKYSGRLAARWEPVAIRCCSVAYKYFALNLAWGIYCYFYR